MMNKTKKKNVYVKYAVIMCISGALGDSGGCQEMGHVHGVLTGIQRNAILLNQCPHLDASADGNLWSDSAGTL